MAALLITAGIVLIVLNVKAVLKENKSFGKVLKNKNDDIQEYEIEIGKLRKEFGETIFEMQNDMESLKERINSLSEKELQYNKLKDIPNTSALSLNDKYDEKEKNIHDNVRETEKDKKDKDDCGLNNIKVTEIDKMVKQGLSDDEIAEKMKIGKGEVLLIKELYLK